MRHFLNLTYLDICLLLFIKRMSVCSSISHPLCYCCCDGFSIIVSRMINNENIHSYFTVTVEALCLHHYHYQCHYYLSLITVTDISF